MKTILRLIKKIIKHLVDSLPTQNIILFESCPDLADNTKPVFDELITRGVNKKYKFIWMCSDPILDSYPKYENVQYLDVKKHRVKTFFLNHRAKVVIFCNRFMGSGRKGQKVYYITHGAPIKDTSKYYCPPAYVDYMITSGVGINDIFSKYAKIDINKCIPLGYPRNDILVREKKDLSNIFGSFSKYVIWYPTVKQFKSGRKTGATNSIPIIHNNDSLNRLNEYARDNDILIIIKPHFAQMKTIDTINQLSNIRFIDDSLFKNNNITSYELVGSCDALITDYSSIYYDYTLCDKPIGLIWEDIELFKENPGLIDGFYDVTRGGEKIYTIDDLLSFLNRISLGVDLLARERNEICEMSNYSRDGKSTQRVVDFVLNQSNITIKHIQKEEIK